MKRISYILLLSICYSCIPLQIAPNLEEGKVYKAKKFKRSLPKQHTYVFTDPKDANEFYYFISSKYQINQDTGENNIPILIENRRYYLSFYEMEKSTQTINLIPLALDATLIANDSEPILEDIYTSRTGNWYIALTITDSNLNDALDPTYRDTDKVVSFATQLQEEYLATQNYNSLLLKKTVPTNK
ncbi:hypothetical protein [Dokdonia pacifica]|uniref:Uncharacterized protein n=1 Tax=Dokdonia pacifica TaxID=1627892 RepID=A0A238VXE0_9FLAO|nr:hypothetical protein [Dokdonia pacifica]SNR38970.1 hypothetical protein SAMN06265376_101479 [Dokdonia pacifica]